ncbi:DUF402 domain-containing protein [Amycolatopsis tolypomycina]|uniref:DUF402 domain-containing protein n=1 Tax=Amycolatopsis tolypomycina TaxID=208445 RepID=UPI0033BBCF55
MTLPTGSTVLRRHFEHDRLTRVWVGRTVSDDERGLALWVPDGSPSRDVIAADGRAFSEVPFAEWETTPKSFDESPWRGDALMFHPVGTGFSVWWFFGAGHEFRNWYVNLERPSERWSDDGLAGIDTTDHDLDIVVTPDRRWEWKDEDLFTEFLRYDHYWVEDAEAVRAAGEAALELVRHGRFPFDGTWCDFRPAAGWEPPESLPDGWDRPRSF